MVNLFDSILHRKRVHKFVLLVNVDEELKFGTYIMQ